MISKSDQARVYSLGLGEARLLVDGERSNGAFWLGEFREDPGFMTSLHSHFKTAENFYVLEGALALYLDEKWIDLEPGTFALVPAGTPHAQGNTSRQRVRFVAWGTPAGFEPSFPEIGELAARVSPGTPEFGREVAKIISRHDTKVLGPPPKRQ